MTQTALPTSTIVQLLYAVPPRLGFAGLVAELRRALPASGGKPPRAAQIGSHTAHFDLPVGRLTLSFQRDVNRAVGACLTVGVGPRPDAVPGALPPAIEAADQTRLARKITQAISARFAPNRTLWHIAPTVITSAVLGQMLSALPEDLPRCEQAQDAAQMSQVLAEIERALADRSLPEPRRRRVGQGFSGHWPPGTMAMGPVPAPPAPGPSRQRSTPCIGPSNSLPALPGLDHTGLRRTLDRLDGTAARNSLTLRLGPTACTIAMASAR